MNTINEIQESSLAYLISHSLVDFYFESAILIFISVLAFRCQIRGFRFDDVVIPDDISQLFVNVFILPNLLPYGSARWELYTELFNVYDVFPSLFVINYITMICLWAQRLLTIYLFLVTYILPQRFYLYNLFRGARDYFFGQ